VGVKLDDVYWEAILGYDRLARKERENVLGL
jgi:hypothetical protein